MTPTDTAGQALVGWADQDRMYVVTFGSGTCPKLPTTVTVGDGNRLTITTTFSSARPCTLDVSPTTSVITVPQGIDDTKPVQVTVDGVSATIPPR